MFQQYLSADERADLFGGLRHLGSTADGLARFAHLSLEPDRRTPDSEFEFCVTLTTWPGGERRILGTASPHGIPTTWER